MSSAQLKVTDIASAVSGSKNLDGETLARRILSEWKGDGDVAATSAAYQLGQLVVGNMLPYDRAKGILEGGAAVRLVSEKHYSTVHESFQTGRASLTSRAELIERLAPANDNGRFSITWFDEVNESVAKEEIVQGVLGAGEFSLFVAKPGTAKSVLLADIGCHIAAGMDWHGHKVRQGLVIFFAAERKLLTERRIAAWRKVHGVSRIPFVVVGGKLDLTTGLIDAQALATTIRTLEEKSGHKCVLIILDTVTRTFGAGDQHQSRDMQKYVQSVDELSRATTAHIAAIHHSPWSDDRGKGAIDLDGAVDVSFVVNVKGSGPAKIFTLSCTGANDGEEGPVTAFRLESVELGTDANGRPTTAPVVVQSEVSTYDGSNLKGNSAKAFESLEQAIANHGQCPPDGSAGFPDGVTTVSREEWRERFYSDTRAKQPAILETTLRSRFNRAIDELVDREKRVAAVGDRFWLTVASVA